MMIEPPRTRQAERGGYPEGRRLGPGYWNRLGRNKNSAGFGQFGSMSEGDAGGERPGSRQRSGVSVCPDIAAPKLVAGSVSGLCRRGAAE